MAGARSLSQQHLLPGKVTPLPSGKLRFVGGIILRADEAAQQAGFVAQVIMYNNIITKLEYSSDWDRLNGKCLDQA